jgi:hypothetical protein
VGGWGSWLTELLTTHPSIRLHLPLPPFPSFYHPLPPDHTHTPFPLLSNILYYLCPRRLRSLHEPLVARSVALHLRLECLRGQLLLVGCVGWWCRFISCLFVGVGLYMLNCLFRGEGLYVGVTQSRERDPEAVHGSITQTKTHTHTQRHTNEAPPQNAQTRKQITDRKTRQQKAQPSPPHTQNHRHILTLFASGGGLAGAAAPAPSDTAAAAAAAAAVGGDLGLFWGARGEEEEREEEAAAAAEAMAFCRAALRAASSLSSWALASLVVRGVCFVFGWWFLVWLVVVVVCERGRGGGCICM